MPARKRPAEDMEADSSAEALDRIARVGDVIFEVGESKQRMLVSSAILSQASTAFMALLGPHFREGQAIRNTGNSPVTIPLPDDEPQAMSDLLRLLHLVKVSELAYADDTGRVLSFAVAADKWCCTDALSLQCHGMMLTAIQRDNLFESRSLSHLTSAAYLLNHNGSFSILAQRLMLYYHGSYMDLWKDDKYNVIPANFYLLLAERREQARASVLPELENLIGACRSCESPFTARIRNEHQKHIMSQLDEPLQPPWQGSRMALKDALATVSELTPFTGCTTEKFCGQCGWEFSFEEYYCSEVVETIETLCTGLSIPCVKEGCNSFEQGSLSCRRDGHSVSETE